MGGDPTEGKGLLHRPVDIPPNITCQEIIDMGMKEVLCHLPHDGHHQAKMDDRHHALADPEAVETHGMVLIDGEKTIMGTVRARILQEGVVEVITHRMTNIWNTIEDIKTILLQHMVVHHMMTHIGQAAVLGEIEARRLPTAGRTHTAGTAVETVSDHHQQESMHKGNTHLESILGNIIKDKNMHIPERTHTTQRTKKGPVLLQGPRPL